MLWSVCILHGRSSTVLTLTTTDEFNVIPRTRYCLSTQLYIVYTNQNNLKIRMLCNCLLTQLYIVYTNQNKNVMRLSVNAIVHSIHQWFPTFFVWRAIYLLWRALRATRLIFYIPSSLLPPFSSPHSPPVQQLGVLGERCKLPQRGLGRSPSRQRILEHSRAKNGRFWHVPRGFAAFKAIGYFSIST